MEPSMQNQNPIQPVPSQSVSTRKNIKFIYAALIITIIGAGVTWVLLNKQYTMDEDSFVTVQSPITRNPTQENTDTIEYYLVKSAPQQEVTAIQGSVAVFVGPTDEKIKHMQTTLDEESYNSVIDDNMNYQAEAAVYLKNHNIAIVDTNTRYFLFVDPQGSTQYIDTHKNKQDFSILFFFKDGSMPKLASMTDIDTEYNRYYGREKLVTALKKLPTTFVIKDNYERKNFQKVFNNLDIAELNQKNNIERDVFPAENACYYHYGIEIDSSMVMVVYRTNHNQDYFEKHPEIDQNDGELDCGEHAYFWKFEFTGGKLLLKDFTIAG